MHSISFQILSKPFSIFCMFAWLLNDSIFKYKYHNLITGKLSDIVGLYIFPFFISGILLSLLQLIISFLNYFYQRKSSIPSLDSSNIIQKFANEKERKIFIFSCFIVGVVFCLININSMFNEFFYSMLNSNSGTMDFTDLFCLPILGLSYITYLNYSEKYFSRFPRLLPIILCALAFINTPAEDENPRGAALLLLLTDIGSDSIIISKPTSSLKVKNTDVIDLEWKYVGYYFGTNPTLGDNFNVCNNATTTTSIHYKLGGRFKGYKIRLSTIQSSNIIKEEIYIPETTITNVGIYSWKLDEKLSLGKYEIEINPFLENKPDCSQKEIDFSVRSYYRFEIIE
ncbi:MAG: hypothetical protein SFU98_13345 [Leptospiraceae bacterium]|nr:hypothetical protein [Leptospiraceae bacterium]